MMIKNGKKSESQPRQKPPVARNIDSLKLHADESWPPKEKVHVGSSEGSYRPEI